MAFILPKYVNPNESLDRSVGQFAGSLDGLFEAYLAGQQQKRQGAEADASQLLTQGFLNRQITPDVIARAQRPAQRAMLGTPAPLPRQPMDVTTSQDPRAFVAGLASQPLDQEQEPEIVRQYRAYKEKRSADSELSRRRVESEIAENEASAWSKRNPRPESGVVTRPPPGYRFQPNGDLEAIPGGPAATKQDALAEMETRAQDSALEQADSQIVKVDQALKNVSGWSTGWGGATFGKLPGSQAKDLQGSVDTIKANLGFSTLAEMKRASPTGGALGAISESEMRLLTSARESLDTAQSQEQLVQNLNAVKKHYSNWKNAVLESRKQGAAGSPGSPSPSPSQGRKIGRFTVTQR